MGMFDTIHFEKPRECPECGGDITSVQTKKFGRLLNDYHVGDCIGHAEESRITREKLHCGNCSEVIEKYVYLAVDREILLGVEGDRQEAEELLGNTGKEKLVLMYHDLHERYREEKETKRGYENFLRHTCRWFREGKHEKQELSPLEKFPITSRHLVNADTPLQAIENFLSFHDFVDALEELEEEGKTRLDIYWLEEISDGQRSWSVDVLQDELNERCGTNWVWTVMNETLVEAEGIDEDMLSFWKIVVDEGYSEETVVKAVQNSLEERGFEFEVNAISPDEAEGSGLLEKLEELEEMDLEPDDFKRLGDSDD